MQLQTISQFALLNAGAPIKDLPKLSPAHLDDRLSDEARKLESDRVARFHTAAQTCTMAHHLYSNPSAIPKVLRNQAIESYKKKISKIVDDATDASDAIDSPRSNDAVRGAAGRKAMESLRLLRKATNSTFLLWLSDLSKDLDRLAVNTQPSTRTAASAPLTSITDKSNVRTWFERYLNEDYFTSVLLPPPGNHLHLAIENGCSGSMNDSKVDGDRIIPIKRLTSGSALDFLSIANSYYRERGDLPKARVFYRLAADLGQICSQALTAHMYLHGEGGETDYAGAYKYASLAKDNDHPTGYYLLSKLHEHGQGCEQDSVYAQELLITAATKGEARAIEELRQAGHLSSDADNWTEALNDMLERFELNAR